jgi:tRNA U34 5-methylaminomethyl-2-thiouridine-forming methyltransferase MnmC
MQAARIVETKEGIHTLRHGGHGEPFHSLHGALQESMHVFIGNGLLPLAGPGKKLSVLEIGFGSGLNALLTLRECERHAMEVHYTAVEAFPLGDELVSKLNYMHYVGEEYRHAFEAMHAAPWPGTLKLGSFGLHKLQADATIDELGARYDVVYYDAFSPAVQPAMWTPEQMLRMREACNPGGVLVTYCARSSVRRNLQAAGFRVERLPGAEGKREMIRAVRDTGP